MSGLFRYFLVGAAAGATDFIIFALLVKGFYLHWFAAAAFSFCVATLANYLLSIRIVFRSGARFGKREEIALVFLISAIGLGINQAIMYCLINFSTIDILLAKICATCFVFFWNFLARRNFVFKYS